MLIDRAGVGAHRNHTGIVLYNYDNSDYYEILFAHSTMCIADGSMQHRQSA